MVLNFIIVIEQNCELIILILVKVTFINTDVVIVMLMSVVIVLFMVTVIVMVTVMVMLRLIPQDTLVRTQEKRPKACRPIKNLV